jgi:hypothetical protein
MGILRSKDPEFTLYCIIQGLALEDGDVADFESHILKECGARIQYLETYLTRPTIKNGVAVPDTGGRSDVIFALHKDDYTKLHRGHRMNMGIRWLDDAISNDPEIYDDRIKSIYV